MIVDRDLSQEPYLEDDRLSSAARRHGFPSAAPETAPARELDFVNCLPSGSPEGGRSRVPSQCLLLTVTNQVTSERTVPEVPCPALDFWAGLPY